MPYTNDCSCNTGIIYGISQCKACGASGCGGSARCQIEITQKRIWNSVRVAASEYIMNVGALNVYVEPSSNFNNVNWNQMSDRPLPSNYLRTSFQIVPSHGNSTKSSLTRDRPGSQAPGGSGVDIKHNSYARYLARLKGKGPLRTQQNTSLTVALTDSKGCVTGQQFAKSMNVVGNKTKSFGIVSTSNKAGSCLCLFPK